IRGVIVASGPGSIDRADFSRRALEFVRSRNQAVEPSHRAAVILLGDACEQLGDAIGGSRQEALIVQLQPGRIGILDHLCDFRHVWRRFRCGGELLARPVDTPSHFEGVTLSHRRLADRADPGLKFDAEADEIEHSLVRSAGRHILLALGVPGIVPHLALRPGHQLEDAAGRMTAFIHEILLRHDMAAIAVLRQLIERGRPDHPLGIGELPARLLLGLGLGLLGLAAEPAVDLDPVLAGAVARLAGDAGNRLLFVFFLLHCVMAVQAQTLRSDALNAHSFRDFVRFLPARHLAKGLVMMRALPGLALLLVTFGTGVWTDDLGRLGRNCAARGKAEDHQQAAQTKHGRLGPEPDRPKSMSSNNDNDFSPLLQPSYTSASAVPAYTSASAVPARCSGDPQRAGASPAWWAQRATPWRGSKRFPRQCRRWSAGTDPHSSARRCPRRSL